jgi:hypothetical protein
MVGGGLVEARRAFTILLALQVQTNDTPLSSS